MFALCFRRSVFFLLPLGVLSLSIFLNGLLPQSAEGIERRRDQYGKDFSYFIYPIASEIPGLGTAFGYGATVLNLFDTDADLTLFNLDGDFAASGYALLDLQPLPRRLVFDVGSYDYRVAPQVFGRGINSPVDQYFLPEVEGQYLVAQSTLTFMERQLEFYFRLAQGAQRVLAIRDSGGNEFGTPDPEPTAQKNITVGGIYDLTDDRLDPRIGFRVEAFRQFPEVNDQRMSEYHVTDYNLTAYIPFRKQDTLAINYYRSSAHVTRQGITDPLQAQTEFGLGCGGLPEPALSTCQGTESARLDEIIATNTYGNATSLGGTQRLRSYPSGRFHAGHSLFYGVEYRWNITDERTPFDVWIARGVRTGFQVAFFAESGSVSDDPSQLTKDMRTSVGVGVRMILSGLVVRFDYATGDEGGSPQLFINYPWGMFSVDSGG